MIKLPITSKGVRTPFVLKTIRLKPVRSMRKRGFLSKRIRSSRRWFYQRGSKKSFKLSKKKSLYEFTAAAWLSFDKPVMLSLHLGLRLKVNNDEKLFWLDSIDAKSNAFMLSGSNEVSIEDSVESVDVICMGLLPEHRCWVEDVHINYSLVDG